MDRLHSFALIKSFYDSGRDYIDAFWPLVLDALAPQDQVSFDDLQDRIQSRFSLTIPIHALETIVTRASRKALVERKARTVQLTTHGEKARLELEVHRDVERRVNQLIEAARKFLIARGITNSTSEVDEALQGFVASNLEFFERLLARSATVSQIETNRDMDAALLEFVREIEESDPDLFKTLREVFLGSVVSSAVYMASFGDVGQNFDRTRVFLDTNLVFSLLGFHFEEFNKPVQELFDLMTAVGRFEFFVFDFTIQEIVAVLRPYATKQHRYVPWLRVSTILSSLKAKGWTPGDMRTFIGSIEERLRERGIAVFPTSIDINSFEVDVAESGALEKYKPNQPPYSWKHDLAAIRMIKDLRGGVARRLERAGSFFLTSDRNLTRYDLEACGHDEAETVGEVVPDRVLTTFLWLKNPRQAGDIPLHAVIAMHSKDLLVDRKTWDSFFDLVIDLRERDEISEGDLGILLFDEGIQDFLRKTRRRDLTKNRVLEEAERVKNRYERAVAAKERDILARADLRLSQVKEQLEVELRQKEAAVVAQHGTEERILDAIAAGKADLKGEAQRQSRLIVRGLILLICVVLVWWVLQLDKGADSAVGRWGLVIAIVAILLGSFLDPKRIRSDAERELFNRLYLGKLKKSRLDLVSLAAGATDAPPSDGGPGNGAG